MQSPRSESGVPVAVIDGGAVRVVLSPPWLCAPATGLPEVVGLLKSVPDGGPAGGLRLGIVVEAAIENVLEGFGGLASESA
jgi:hypothetical protein